ncbi:hypothetical protein IJ596_08660, partial [bacterium]|nr:hypothetical protein [bacterium]
YKIAMQVKGFIPDQKENPKELIKYVMSDEKILKINSKLEEEFLKKYPNESQALVFAAVEAFAPFFEQIKNLDNLVKLYQFSPFTLYTLFSDFKKDEGIKYFTDERIKCIPKIYDRITARCNNSEIQNAAYNIEKSLNNYDPRYLSQQLGKDRNQLEVMNTYTIASIVKSGNRNKILELRKVIMEHLKKHNYEAKAIQADGLPNLVMTVALEKIVNHITSENREKIQKILQAK